MGSMSFPRLPQIQGSTVPNLLGLRCPANLRTSTPRRRSAAILCVVPSTRLPICMAWFPFLSPMNLSVFSYTSRNIASAIMRVISHQFSFQDDDGENSEAVSERQDEHGQDDDDVDFDQVFQHQFMCWSSFGMTVNLKFRRETSYLLLCFF